MKMNFEVLNQLTNDVQFVAEIECEAGATEAIKLGLAVKWAVNSGADLRFANLFGADLRGANLRFANLFGADLRFANMTGAKLTGADLREADLRGANLYGANLRRADLTGSIGNFTLATATGRNNQEPQMARSPDAPVRAKKIQPSKATEGEINEGRPEHLRRVYAIKKYSGKGNSYAARGIMCFDDACAELKRLAENHVKAGRDVVCKDTSAIYDSFTVDEGTDKLPKIVEYKIV